MGNWPGVRSYHLIGWNREQYAGYWRHPRNEGQESQEQEDDAERALTEAIHQPSQAHALGGGFSEQSTQDVRRRISFGHFALAYQSWKAADRRGFWAEFLALAPSLPRSLDQRRLTVLRRSREVR